MADSLFKPALFWKDAPEKKSSVICELCPRNCTIPQNSYGFCRVRKNIDGTLFSCVYGYPASINIDPIEKKPISKFMSGTKTFSIGTFGCNLDCSFCQNYSLSKKFPDFYPDKNSFTSPSFLLSKALEYKCKSISFTYNEPTVWAEYAIDIAKEARKIGLPVVLVSNGYISEAARKELYPLIDAANIDMKGFSESFYSVMCSGSLKPVLDSIVYLREIGKHIELTNLIIPGKNDSDEDISSFLDWLELKLNKSVPLHFSAFFPTYKYFDSPPTDRSTLFKIRDIANERGFTNIFLGNI